MKKYLLKIIMKVVHWLWTSKGTRLFPYDLERVGWVMDKNGYYVEPNIKDRDKIWIQFEHHYYRVYHGENRTFIELRSTKEWLQFYLFVLDNPGCGLTTRNSLQ